MTNPVTKKREGGIIGLNKTQIEFIEGTPEKIGVADKLRSGNPDLMREYLTLSTRDKRFDRTVLKAIEEGTPVKAGDVAKIIGRLRDKNVQLRGETIARDQSLTALRAGRREGYVQLLESGTVTEDQIERSWDATGDKRTRLSHMALDGQKVIGLTAPYVSPVTGAMFLYPGDTSLGAPPEEVILCRCFERVRIRYIR